MKIHSFKHSQMDADARSKTGIGMGENMSTAHGVRRASPPTEHAATCCLKPAHTRLFSLPVFRMGALCLQFGGLLGRNDVTAGCLSD